MQFLSDADALVFLSTLARILIFGPLHLRRNAHPLPRRYEIESIPAEALTEAQQRHLQKFDDKMAVLNYRPVATYRAANYGTNMIRSYVNPAEPVRCVLMMVEVTVNVSGVRSSAHSSTIEFFTFFADDTVLVTRNMQLRSLFDELPYRTTQECPRVTDPGELRRRHLAAMEKLNRVPKPPASDFTAISREFQTSHERFCQYQLGRRNLRPDRSGELYLTTAKVHWRGIRNFLNPFAQRFVMARFVPAAMAGIALPVFAHFYASSMLAAGGNDATAKLAVAICYAAAGAVVGACLQKSNFLWTFIFTYLAAGAIVGFGTNPLPYGTIAAVSADVFARWQKRRKLILQSHASRQSLQPAALGPSGVRFASGKRV